MRRRAIIAMTLLAGIGVMIPRIARGQESRGTIVGTVTDASGGAIPEATVQVTNIGTNVSTEVTTNMSGNFRVPYLLSGQYTVKVKMVGFKDYVHRPRTAHRRYAGAESTARGRLALRSG